MTREEAKNIVTEVANKNKTIVWLLDTDVFKIIDMIYDDFEDKCGNCKICRNCKYFDCEEDYGFCMNDWWKKGNEVDGDLLRVEADFGCNKFERR